MKNGPVKATCARCGKEIPIGRAMYEVRVEVTSDFDGFLPDYDDMEAETERALADARGASASELEDDVYQEFTGTVCRSCVGKVSDEIRESIGTPRKKRGIPRLKIQ